jgi:flavin reductase (DIM6/NTAB) family NADH-FMN oxidoreductase RutF
MNQDATKHLLRSLGSGVHVLGALDERGVPALSTVSWVTQISSEPRLLGVALHVESRILAAVRASRAFTLSVLPADARQVASRLGRASEDVPAKHEGVALSTAPETGAPAPEASLGWLECAVRDEHRVGDHVLIVGEVLAGTQVRDGEPLTLSATGWRYGV